MPELGSYGSVRGARGNSRPYREKYLLLASISLLDPKRTFWDIATQEDSDRHWLGERPTNFLNARLNAASDS